MPKSTEVNILVRRTYAQTVYRPRKDSLFKTKNDKLDTQNSRKNIPWLAARPHSSSETQGLLARTMRYFGAKVYFKS